MREQNKTVKKLTASVAGSGSIFAETPVGLDTVYWFPEGNFCVSWYYELPGGEWVTCYGCNSRYDVLTNSREVGTAALAATPRPTARSSPSSQTGRRPTSTPGSKTPSSPSA